MNDDIDEPSEGSMVRCYLVVIFFLKSFCETGVTRSIFPFVRQSFEYTSFDTLTVMNFHLGLKGCSVILSGVSCDYLIGPFQTLISFTSISIFSNIVLFAGAAIDDKLAKDFAALGIVIMCFGVGGSTIPLVTLTGHQFQIPTTAYLLLIEYLLLFGVSEFAAVLGGIAEPMVRRSFTCFGDSTCFPLIFGSLAVIETFCLAILLTAKSQFIHHPPGNTDIFTCLACLKHAAIRKFRLGRKHHHSQESHEHWVDYASDSCSKEIIVKSKCLLSVLLIIPMFVFYHYCIDCIPAYWVYFGERLDSGVDLFGFRFVIPPETTPSCVSLFSCVCCLLLAYCVQPILKRADKRRGFFTFNKFVISGVSFCIGFALTALLSIVLERRGAISNFASVQNSHLIICNAVPKSEISLKITQPGVEDPESIHIHPLDIYLKMDNILNDTVLSYTLSCGDSTTSGEFEMLFHKKTHYMVLRTEDGTLKMVKAGVIDIDEDIDEDNIRLRVLFSVPDERKLVLQETTFHQDAVVFSMNPKKNFRSFNNTETDWYAMTVGSRRHEVFLCSGGVYFFVYIEEGNETYAEFRTLITGYYDSVWLLVPPSFFMGLARATLLPAVFFFVYVNAPKNMKGLCLGFLVGIPQSVTNILDGIDNEFRMLEVVLRLMLSSVMILINLWMVILIGLTYTLKLIPQY